MKRFVLTLAILASTTPSLAAEPATRDEAQLRAHVAFLASDAMRGREAGSPEFDIAAEYVAARFAALGLKPAGDKGQYLQAVPLVASKLNDKGSLSLVGPKGEVALVFGDEFVLPAQVKTANLRMEAPLVFVGFGVVAPDYGRDDYAGIDVKGKIVVVLSGAPKSFGTEERAHYGSTKALAAEARGAIGIISVETPTRAKVRPMSSYVDHWDQERMVWRQPDGKGFELAGGTLGLGTISLKGAEKLFSGFPGGAAAIMQAAETKKAKLASRPMFLSARIASNSVIRKAESSNVVGMFEGSDPALKAEVVILSAHLDHVGISKPVNGDSINNGAMDNAIGIASMLEVARHMADSATKPKRSVMFLAVTGEEKGLVGSDYFARHPTIPRAAMVADVNLDMPILTYDFEDVIAFGAGRSSLGPIVRTAAASLNIALSPDPTPDQTLFVRSDHYRFVQQGVPSVFLATGEMGPGKLAGADFLKNHYHKPSDDLTLPVSWKAGVRFVALNLAIAQGLANAPEPLRWNKGDFFGRLYNGVGAR